MAVTQSMQKKLEYLVRVTGRSESEIIAQAVDQGLTELYRRQVGDAYLRSELDRDKAVAELGRDAVEDLDYAREAIDADVAWGLKSA